jgi:LysR family cyn operon transcriptional activator
MEPLFSEWLTLVAGFTHPLPRGAAVSPRQLAELPLASFTGMFVSRRYIDDYCSLHGIEPRIALEANSISAVLEIIRRGELAAILPSAMQNEHRDLRYISLDPPFPIRAVALLRRQGAYRTAASIAFCTLLKDMLQDGELSSLETFASECNSQRDVGGQ